MTRAKMRFPILGLCGIANSCLQSCAGMTQPHSARHVRMMKAFLLSIFLNSWQGHLGLLVSKHEGNKQHCLL